jgi:hypothetical protein
VLEKGEYDQGHRMSKAISTWEGWQPQSAPEREAILRELREIVASPQFCNSKRYPALLQHVVENTLAGRSELLKERTLGVEVFDRPPTYDTNTDTVVRYTAGEVRKRLLLYYSEHGRGSNIRISLPAGSYIPEFLHGNGRSEELGDAAEASSAQISEADLLPARNDGTLAPELVSPHAPSNRLIGVASMAETIPAPRPGRARKISRSLIALALAAVVVVAAIAGWSWRFGATQPQAAVDDFWGPVLRDQRTVVVCTGAVVFAPNNVSGTNTAGKDIAYPFVSMEGASAISLVSALLEHSGESAQLRAAGATPLSELREHPIILLGGFNNKWTMRLLDPLRFHFVPEPYESIVDRMQPQKRWTRDPSLPYFSADDYALVARYRDATTGSWVVVLAGVGRNGTEAAAQFATSPHYMQMLRDQLRGGFSNRNIEAVLKVSVIDGKTGAPSILAVHSW